MLIDMEFNGSIEEKKALLRDLEKLDILYDQLDIIIEDVKKAY